MYMSILGKPTDKDVLLTSPHEWDPSVLDYSHPIPVDIPPGHLIIMQGTNVTQE